MENQSPDASLLIPILKKIPLFANLDDAAYNTLLPKITLMYYPKDHIVFNEGDSGDAMYLVKKGSMQVFHAPTEAGDAETPVANIGVGGFFGEMALISEAPRNAAVRTLEESEVFILKKSDFQSLLSTNPNLAQQVSATVVSRTNENDKNSQNPQ